MAFIKNLNDDEIRSAFLVQSDKKKVWERWLELWQELDRICRKHEINYWANNGTLLGAARHSGFIPWGTTMNFCMMRPEFNRFCEVVDGELNSELFEVGEKLFFNCRIFHSQTTLLRSNDFENHEPQGLMIDVFPLDINLDGTPEAAVAIDSLNEILGAVYSYPALVEHKEKGGMIVNNWQSIEKVHSLIKPEDQVKFLNVFAEGLFNYSSTVDFMRRSPNDKTLFPHKKEWFRQTIYLPFESVEIPAPIDYEKVLTNLYGDWRKPVRSKKDKLGRFYSADIPYKESMKLFNLKLLEREEKNKEDDEKN